MILVAARQLQKAFGSEPILDHVSFELYSGQRIGLVGPNGCGKTTLLRIVAGHDTPDRGILEITSGTRIGFVEQHLACDPNVTVEQFARQAFAEELKWIEQWEQAARSLAKPQAPEQRMAWEHRYDELAKLLHQRDAFRIEHKVQRVLHGLGFNDEQLQFPVRQLSGGQQNRLALARLLLGNYDLLCLDEPTNHLDLEATNWLEEYLSETNQAIILVSHDRYLLNRTTEQTWELFRGTLEVFPGNYAAYRQQKSERLLVAQRTYQRQQQQIERWQEFIRRHHYGQKHAQAQDRRRKLERLVPIPPPREIPIPRFGFPDADRSGDVVLRVERVAKRFDRSLFQDLSFDVLRGQKWGIIGPNGCGKTTLLRILIGQIPPDAGSVQLGTNVRVAYCDQHLRFLRQEQTVLDAIAAARAGSFPENERRALLARFGMESSLMELPVKSLSGGQRTRVALAFLAACHANLLVLDEPTNHLDLWAREALETALREFKGTILFVTHDRFLLDRVADHLIVLEPKRIWVVEGNYERFRNMAQARQVAAAASTSATAGDAAQQTTGRPLNCRTGSPRRSRRFPYRKPLEIEADIRSCEERTQEIQRMLMDPVVLRDGPKVRALKEEMALIEQRLQELYEHWQEVLER